MKVIPFYLPQYHTIPENDEWWGKGFTEWTNVKKAIPLFEGHEQPKKPLNDNYYCLLDDDVKKWQIELAKENGIYGFCFYHYWFNGHMLLEKPLDQYLNNKELDFPFCFCWANSDWTKIWAGKGSEVLISQDYYDKEDWEAHFQYLLQFFKDDRYITENGEPLFVIYSPEEIPNLEDIVTFLRKRIKEEGFPGIKLLYQYYVTPEKDAEIRKLFDYRIRFQPVHALHELEDNGIKGGLIKALHVVENVVEKVTGIAMSDHLLRVRKTSYDDVWNNILEYNPIDEKDVAGAFVNWDNTPRRGNSGRITTGATPQKFENYLRQLFKKVKDSYSSDYVFVTAWNEWSEGSYLEPDQEDGSAYLNAIKEVCRYFGELENE